MKPSKQDDLVEVHTDQVETENIREVGPIHAGLQIYNLLGINEILANIGFNPKAEELDGGYVLKTNRKDLDVQEIWRTYMLLTRVENAFRAMKSPLGERPIFHHLEHRAQTHIFLCVLAYHLLIVMQNLVYMFRCNTPIFGNLSHYNAEVGLKVARYKNVTLTMDYLKLYKCFRESSTFNLDG